MIPSVWGGGVKKKFFDQNKKNLVSCFLTFYAINRGMDMRVGVEKGGCVGF